MLKIREMDEQQGGASNNGWKLQENGPVRIKGSSQTVVKKMT